jgi:peptidoglycan/LPS O-acetylase OafA/YrhL
MLWTAARFPAAPIGRVLNWAPLAWLGRLSYSLYLWQQVFLDPGNGARWMCRFPQNLGLAFAAAVASYYLVELPFLGLKNTKPRARREPATASDVSITPALLRAA